MNNVIYVTGNIIGESGHHVAREWVCLADESYKSDALQVIDGNLILTNESKTIPYCTYAAEGGVTCTYGNIEWLGDPDFLQNRYFKEIDKFKRLSEIDIPNDLLEDHLKCINAGVFAEFESFLIELLSFLILSKKSNYDEYIERKGIDADSVNVFKEVYESIHNIIGHNMGILRSEFDALHYAFPDASAIGRQIKFRHDVIHRSGKKVMGNHLKRLAFTNEGLNNLINDCNNFVMNVMDAIKNSN